jgi:hypothetical protein
MTYTNPFGGIWVSTPFNDSARAQSWSPALDEDWDYYNNRMYGVNMYVISFDPMFPRVNGLNGHVTAADGSTPNLSLLPIFTNPTSMFVSSVLRQSNFFLPDNLPIRATLQRSTSTLFHKIWALTWPPHLKTTTRLSLFVSSLSVYCLGLTMLRVDGTRLH